MHYDKFATYDLTPVTLSKKEQIRNQIYAQAGDDKSILGRTNDMSQWLFLSLLQLLQAITEAENLESIKSVSQELIDGIGVLKLLESTVDLKGAQAVTQRFLDTNHAVALALKEQHELEENENV